MVFIYEYPVLHPLQWVHFVITLLTYFWTILCFIGIYGVLVSTLRRAPVEISEYLGNLRQQLCEERWALRQQTRELRAKIASARAKGERYRVGADLVNHHHHYNRHDRRRRRSRRSEGGYCSDEADCSPCGLDDCCPGEGSLELMRLTLSEHTLTLHHSILRDLWRQFKDLERPFLVAPDVVAKAVRDDDRWSEDDFVEVKIRADIEAHGEAGSFSGWTATYSCTFMQRITWYRTKDNVRLLSDKLQRLMLQRMAREVSHIRMMVKGLVRHDAVEAGCPKKPCGCAGGCTHQVQLNVEQVHCPKPASEETCSSSSSSANTRVETKKVEVKKVEVKKVEERRDKSVVSVWRFREDDQVRQTLQRRVSERATRPPDARIGRQRRRTSYVVQRSSSEGGLKTVHVGQ
ncbi:hypothetical protein MCOR07_010872 [Pyricularia oryzae]|uniref:Uncharacterized protein n=1 Tax=Pyricularia grisea TaxID=148305 RepID=A0ABQ8NHA8_PYRGI|nr:hypothetical protein MCOR19_004125 [Pyricularia oryzae]KAI6297095.1 hypothetical protein MCOR33_006481 [Pyricularia grisea]KAI6385798.1 hypothetical protein MCOR32_001230 [Pyricularia oryzae]KAI6413307.1 hypothetical protein MCOR20_002934 [Pyricularia oryzae]KAI6447718.1 hypothetical protein MCOR22_003224 [Pyricularia oryzae]